MAFESYYKLVKYKKPIPFYVEDVSGNANTVSIKKGSSGAPTLTIETSTDNRTWTTLGQTSTTALNISIPTNGRVYVRCNANAWANSLYINQFSNATGNFKVGGNIMSLLYGSAYTGEETSFPSGSSNNFYDMFKGNTRLVDASALELPAITLASYCYYSMFQGCTNLTTAPAILPATTLASNCYYSMFNNCTSLTTAPALPATTLQSDCYNRMFGGCTSLTTAPALPATTLVQRCYQYVFYGCTSLNSVTCLATDITASNCTDGWLTNVSATGTFTKAASMSGWTTGVNGIPSGWTIQNA